MAAIQCTDCGTVMLAHCSSTQCHWWRCDNRECPWWIYDLLHGSRSTLDGKVEQIGAPPETGPEKTAS